MGARINAPCDLQAVITARLNASLRRMESWSSTEGRFARSPSAVLQTLRRTGMSHLHVLLSHPTNTLLLFPSRHRPPSSKLAPGSPNCNDKPILPSSFVWPETNLISRKLNVKCRLRKLRSMPMRKGCCSLRCRPRVRKVLRPCFRLLVSSVRAAVDKAAHVCWCCFGRGGFARVCYGTGSADSLTLSRLSQPTSSLSTFPPQRHVRALLSTQGDEEEST